MLHPFPATHRVSYVFPSSYPLRFAAGRSARSFPRRFRRLAVKKDADVFTEKSGYLFDMGEGKVDSLAEYDLQKITAIYQKRPLVLLRRLLQVGSRFGRWFASRYLDSVLNKSDLMFELRAAELREILLELGPAYIKIAQAISSRADLVPPSYLDQLSLLQDRIAPFSSETAFKTIEQELGSPVEVIFSEITPEPVAAASLGQVYKAKLRSNGRVVAVKVQRPGVQAAISLDILILRFLATVVKKVGKFNSDLQGIIDEWATSLFREMDYVNEAKNGQKFRKLYGGINDVIVPEMYFNFTSRKVIVMQWIEGKKLSDLKDLYLIEVGVYCSFNQLLEYGFYHADPHPGNLLRTYNGKLAYIDFGMMGEFSQELRDGFIEACLHLVNRDYDALAKDFITLGLLPPTADKSAVTSALTGVFQNAVAKGIRNISFGDLSGNLGITMYKFKFRIPSYFSLVIRSLAVLEGIAMTIDPTYKVLGSTYPWIARKVLTDNSPKLNATLRSILYRGGVFKIDRLESLISESRRATTSKSIVRSQAENVNTSAFMKEIISSTLTNKGAFVKDILMDEIAKGVEALGLATFDSLSSVVTRTSLDSSALVSQEDLTNLQTLRHLVLLVSGVGTTTNQKPNESATTNTEELLMFFYRFPSLADILPVVSAINELPEDVQQQLSRLPVDLVGRVLSRSAARTIRRFLFTN